MSITPEAFLHNVDQLISLPDICFRINEMADDPNASAADMANVIGRDPNLTTQLLRIANSPYYGFPAKVETISRAITVIGTQDLRDLVLSTSVINAFSHESNQHINAETYWSHSVFTGLLARELAKYTKTKVLCRERLFVAGLLHDVGQLVMSMKIPEIMNIIVARVQQNAEPYQETEQLIFGLDHCEIGAALMKKWHLPESIQTVSRYHHEPEKADDYLLEVSIVHIANAMAYLADKAGLSEREQIKISAFAWKTTGLSKKEVVAAVEKVKVEFVKSAVAFVPLGKTLGV